MQLSVCRWGTPSYPFVFAAAGVKPEQAAKLASKHFACGSSFQKGQPGLKPFVEIQVGQCRRRLHVLLRFCQHREHCAVTRDSHDRDMALGLTGS